MGRISGTCSRDKITTCIHIRKCRGDMSWSHVAATRLPVWWWYFLSSRSTNFLRTFCPRDTSHKIKPIEIRVSHELKNITRHGEACHCDMSLAEVLPYVHLLILSLPHVLKFANVSTIHHTILVAAKCPCNMLPRITGTITLSFNPE